MDFKGEECKCEEEDEDDLSYAGRCQTDSREANTCGEERHE